MSRRAAFNPIAAKSCAVSVLPACGLPTACGVFASATLALYLPLQSRGSRARKHPKCRQNPRAACGVDKRSVPQMARYAYARSGAQIVGVTNGSPAMLRMGTNAAERSRRLPERATAPRKYCAPCPFGLGCRDRRSYRSFCEIGTRALPMLVSQLPVGPPRDDLASGAQRRGQSQAGLST